MRTYVNTILGALLILGASILWCEYGYYYYVFHFKCRGWPEPQDASGQAFVRILVLSDIHIMGPRRSVYWDKIRREWEMKQAFSFSTGAYQPDVIIFLGDIFDEGSFSGDDLFEKAKSDFDKIFPYDANKYKRIMVIGNHDVGYHDQMISFPYVVDRFHYTYGSTPTIELLDDTRNFKELNLIVMNSMAFYNDSCPYCTQSIANTNRISRILDEIRTNQSEKYVAPILLTHIPLYRPDDTHCDFPRSLRDRVKTANIEGKDVLHKKISRFLLSGLKPRLILSGHTHMDCLTTHKLSDNETDVVNEITVTSFNHKYAEKKPSLLLLSVNSTDTFTRICQPVEEWVIVIIYVTTIVIIISRFFLLCINRNNESPPYIRHQLIEDETNQ